MKKQITVLFAGGIGSGKSTVLGYIQELYGIPVFYSDYEAKELYKDRKILAHVNKIVGGGIITKDGTLDKAALAKIIFNDANKKKKLEDDNKVWQTMNYVKNPLDSKDSKNRYLAV